MEKYIPEAYKKVSDMLEPIEKKYQLDSITVESLVRSSIEVEEQDIQPVTAIWKSKDGKIYSTKPSNIKINLKFALSSVFSLKTILVQEDFWLVLAILHMIVDSFISATKEIDEVSSVVLVAVYRLECGDLERILGYVNKICPSSLIDKASPESIQESLEKLESWGCITSNGGKYVVNETVTASMIKEYPEI